MMKKLFDEKQTLMWVTMLIVVSSFFSNTVFAQSPDPNRDVAFCNALKFDTYAFQGAAVWMGYMSVISGGAAVPGLMAFLGIGIVVMQALQAFNC